MFHNSMEGGLTMENDKDKEQKYRLRTENCEDIEKEIRRFEIGEVVWVGFFYNFMLCFATARITGYKLIYNPDDSKPYYQYKIDSLNREEKKNVFAIRNTLLECMNEAKKVLGKSKLILE